jgi:vacuolar-type H+-ATPase subunit H
MYQNLASEMRDGFKPMMNIFDIQNRTAQKLLREQTDFWGDCLDVSTRRAETLRGSQDPSEFFRTTADTNREIGERWLSSADRQWNILMEARQELTGEIQTAAQNAEANVNRATNEARSTVSEAVGQAQASANETASESHSTASKSTQKSEPSGSASKKS